ncbi:hypothetical protein BDR07DRAFT_1387428 [Suillus spraguei]|nr:hypothetical protein BDR07DRAFT_1387428 [Suillus spraguei]
MRWHTTVRQFLWGELPSSKLERRLLLKLDWFILSYCCLMYFTNCEFYSFTLDTGHFACTAVSEGRVTNIP